MLKKLVAKISGETQLQDATQLMKAAACYGVPFNSASHVAIDPGQGLLAVMRRGDASRAFIIGAELAAIEIPTQLLPNATVVDLQFVPSLKMIVVTTTKKVNLVDFGSWTSTQFDPSEAVKTAFIPTTMPADITASRVLLGMPTVCVGMSDGRIRFADCFRQGWSEMEISIQAILKASKYAYPEEVVASRETNMGTMGAVTNIVPYASDPNAMLVTNRFYPVVTKLYVLENRVSALFVVPVRQTDEMTDVTCTAVTPGGGYVVAGTTMGRIYVWYEKGDKKSDRTVPIKSTIFEGNGPIRYMSLYQSNGNDDLSVINFVCNKGLQVGEMNVNFNDAKRKPLVRIVSVPAKCRVCSLVPIFSSPWPLQQRGAQGFAALMVTANGEVSLSHLTIPVAATSSAVCAEVRHLSAVNVTMPLSGAAVSELYPEANGSRAFGPSSVIPGAAHAGEGIAWWLGGVSPFESYTGICEDDRAHIHTAMLPSGEALSAKAFPMSGLHSAQKLPFASPVPPMKILHVADGRMAIALFGTGSPFGTNVLAVATMASSDSMRAPPPIIHKLKFDSPSELAMDFCVHVGDLLSDTDSHKKRFIKDVGMFALVRTNANNVYAYSFGMHRTTMAMPALLLPGESHITSMDVALLQPSGEDGSSKDLTQLAQQEPVLTLLAGLSYRSILAFDLVKQSILCCRSLSKDEKKDPERLGVTKVRAVFDRDVAVVEKSPDPSPQRTSVSGDSMYRQSLADFAPPLVVNAPLKTQPFILPGTLAIRVTFAAGIPQDQTGIAVVGTDSPLGAKLALITPIGSAIIGAELSTNEKGQLLVRGYTQSVQGGNVDTPTAAEPHSSWPTAAPLKCTKESASSAKCVGFVLTVAVFSGEASVRSLWETRPEAVEAPAAASTEAAEAKSDASEVSSAASVPDEDEKPETAEEQPAQAEKHADPAGDMMEASNTAPLAASFEVEEFECNNFAGSIESSWAAPHAASPTGSVLCACAVFYESSPQTTARMGPITVESGNGAPFRFVKLEQPAEEAPSSTLVPKTQSVIAMLGRSTIVRCTAQELLNSTSSAVPKVIALQQLTPKQAAQVLALRGDDDTLASEVTSLSFTHVELHSASVETACVAVILKKPRRLIVLEAATLQAIYSAPIDLPVMPEAEFHFFGNYFCSGQLYVSLISYDRRTQTTDLFEVVLDTADVEDDGKTTPFDPEPAPLSVARGWSQSDMRQYNLFTRPPVLTHQPSYQQLCSTILDALPSGGAEESKANTQREQGFFKRLITTSWTGQVAKVSSRLETLKPVEEFDGFVDRVVSDGDARMSVNEREELLGGRASRGKNGGANPAASAAAGVAETRNTMNENLQMVNERGEKIGRLEMKMAEIEKESNEFADLAKQLRQKEQKKVFGIF